MKVLIDAHMVGSQETGNETYTANLLQHLHAVMGDDLAAATVPGRAWPLFLRATPITRLPLAPANDWGRLIYSLPRLCRRWQADLLHVTYVAPFFVPCRFVVSIHDVAFRRYPHFFPPRVRLLFSTLMLYTMVRAKAIITISEHARQEIEHFYPFTRGKVHVTLLAHNRHLFRPLPAGKSRAMCQKYGIDADFILTVGNIQPRKNLVRVIKAFAGLRADFPRLRLVIVGPSQWQASAVYRTVAELGLEDAVIFAGYVPNADLVALYNAARLYLYPSLYEGFGLPVLEAMACGTPVVTSNVAPFPEVAGEAALTVDPHRVSEIAAAMRAVLSDDGLAERLRQKGLAQCQVFSWQTTAAQTVAIYRQVMHDTAA